MSLRIPEQGAALMCSLPQTDGHLERGKSVNMYIKGMAPSCDVPVLSCQ